MHFPSSTGRKHGYTRLILRRLIVYQSHIIVVTRLSQDMCLTRIMMLRFPTNLTGLIIVLS